MPPLIPDVPYKIQGIFIVTFSYIWTTAFVDNYEDPLPADGPEREEILRQNTLRGLMAVVIFMLSFSYLKPFLTQIFEPYQRYWRMVSTLSQLYLSFIIFMLHQRPETGRWLLGFLDPQLNKPVTKEMHTYDEECDFTVENLWGNVDHYFLIHLIDWFLASLVIRDAYILHLWQVLDEWIEISAQHILPHFAECWWDHLLMDILLTNIPAIYMGMKFVKWMGYKEYDWLGRKGKKSIKEWDIFYNHRRFGVFCYTFVLLLIHFLAGFFIINCFLVPPKHVFTITRLFLWFGFGNIALREGYEDVVTWGSYERKDHPVEGRHRWLAVGILLTEGFVCYKYRKGTGNIMDNPTPLWVSLPWGITFGSMLVFWCYLRFKKDRVKKYIERPTETKSKKIQ